MASRELRALEEERVETDRRADDVARALELRRLATLTADNLGAGNLAAATQAVYEYGMVHGGKRALIVAGPHTNQNYARSKQVLQRSVMERFRTSVDESDLKGISELTPLLGRLDLAEKGVGLYLKYGQSTLSVTMDKNLEEDEALQFKQEVQEKELSKSGGTNISRAEQRRIEQAKVPPITICSKLARIYNSGVTFLRHHLPMVAYSLGSADGDAALVQLVHIEVEKRCVIIIRDYCKQNNLVIIQRKAKDVSRRIEDRHVDGNGGIDTSGGGKDSNIFEFDTSSSLTDGQGDFASHEDCGFQALVGPLAAVDATNENLALLLQHTESYERFVRHAVEEVQKAQDIRLEQQVKESNQSNYPKGNDGNFPVEPKRDVLPVRTELNEVVAEVGGIYSSLEHALLLASMQRAIVHASDNDGNPHAHSLYSPLAIVRDPRGALQTSTVEECLYAARRSTLRAFATGHKGTASAAANMCADALGRVLLESLERRANNSVKALKPGEGLLPAGRGGIGRATALGMAALVGSAQKGISKSMARQGDLGSSSSVLGSSDKGTEEAIKRGIDIVVAQRCARLNDLEVAAEYAQRLKSNLLDEVGTSYDAKSRGTEQLRTCIMSFTPVVDSFLEASSGAVEQLTGALMGRVRAIVNETVGQDSGRGSSDGGSKGGTGVGSKAVGGSSFGSVMGGVGSTSTQCIGMNYHLNDEAFEMGQISEGYMARL